MATAQAAKARAGARGKDSDKTVEASVNKPSRREFLYYIWGASMVMALGEAAAGFIWFAFPRFREGEFGGTFTIPGTEIPAVGAEPISKPEGRFWLSNADEGFVSLYAVCTHLGCLPKWIAVNGRFECPCHGSMFAANGTYIAGPAPRNMDVFKTTVIFTNGDVVEMNSDGEPIPLQGRTIDSVRIDTGTRILGKTR